MFLTANLDVYKQAKQTKRQTNRQTLARRSSQEDARPLRLKALYLRTERKIYGRKRLSILLRVASFSESIDCWFFCTRAFVHVCATNRVEIEAASQTRCEIFQTNERTNERTNEYCAKRRRLKSTRPQSKSLR